MSGRSIALVLLTGLCIGRLRPAPGTIGSLPPVLLALTLAWLLRPDLSVAMHWWIVNGCLIAVAVGCSVICVGFGQTAEEHFGVKDPPDVVVDEIAGQSLALLFLPWRSAVETNALIWNLSVAATAYVTFRAIDIFKPPPLFALQRLPSGWGMLADDLVAGIYALTATQLMVRPLMPMLWN